MRSGSGRVAYVSRFNLTASFGTTQERPAAEPAGIALLSKDGRFVANTSLDLGGYMDRWWKIC